eukprot:TRINITY_DN2692_c0_g1_i13.p1 TRINITY_DN2692_c0_g1~~TRINITY_DN2692_c0_g1_i13.p1  ORF type:complete len:291 (-),score=58.47 TRINITY_DN2692_c0_g1_i13:41-913(-)
MGTELLQSLKMLEGESKELIADTVFYWDKALKFSGYLVLTNYRILFVPQSPQCCYLCRISSKFLNVPWGLVDEIGEGKQTANCVEIRTKDFRRLRFILPYNVACSTIIKLMKVFAFPGVERKSFAFAYSPFEEAREEYDLEEEYKRMGVDQKSSLRIYTGARFARGETGYPKKLVVPKSLANKEIEAAANLWTVKRFPVLSHYSKESGASLWRSSKGIKTCSRAKDVDSRLIQAIMGVSKEESWNECSAPVDFDTARLHIVNVLRKAEGLVRSEIPVSYTHLTLPTICSV